jgi:DNA-directed RNA polymerase specialized sigma24 family protein
VTPNELLLATAEGDHTAFIELCDRMDFSARLIVKGHVQEPHQVDLVLQSVHDEAWRTAASFDPGETTANQWLLELARRHAAARARRLRRLPADRVVRSLRREAPEQTFGTRADLRVDTTSGEAAGGDARHDPVARQLRRLRASVAKLVA